MPRHRGRSPRGYRRLRHRKTTVPTGFIPLVHRNPTIHVLVADIKGQWIAGDIMAVHAVELDGQGIHAHQAFDGRPCKASLFSKYERIPLKVIKENASPSAAAQDYG